MKRFLFACFVSTLILSTPGEAQSGRTDHIERGQVYFEKATTSLVDWLRKITGSIDKIVKSENKARLIVRLRELNTAVYNVEASKAAYIRRLIDGSPQPDAEVAALTINISALKHQLDGVVILLREQYQLGGAE